MSYPDKIFEAMQNLNKLQESFTKFKGALQALKVGDTVYENGVYGDYHPQIILKIDIDKGRIFTYEKSINKKQWKTSFYLLNKTEERFEFYC